MGGHIRAENRERLSSGRAGVPFRIATQLRGNRVNPIFLCVRARRPCIAAIVARGARVRARLKNEHNTLGSTGRALKY